jgi:predicted O-linked N-acetylglucosamine transferase (SPINDLY family)
MAAALPPKAPVAQATGQSLGSLSVLELVGLVERARLQGLEWQQEKGIYTKWLAISREPGLHIVQFNLRLSLQAHGKLVEARVAYGACLLEQPRFAPAAIKLGLVYEVAHPRDEGIALWREAPTLCGRVLLASFSAGSIRAAGAQGRHGY